MTNRLLDTIDRLGLKQTELAARLGWSQATLNRRIHGTRALEIGDARALLAELQKLDTSLTLDNLFGEPRSAAPAEAESEPIEAAS